MKTGELKNIGTHRLGYSIYDYYECVDCKTAYPVIRGFPSCNGERIDRCPYCKPQPKNNLCSLPRDAITKQRSIIMDNFNTRNLRIYTATVPSHSRGILTPHKRYTLHNPTSTGGQIKDDNGDMKFVAVAESGFLDGEAWIIEEATPTTTLEDATITVGGDIYQRGKINGKSITSVVSSLQDHKREVVRIEKQLTAYEKLFLNY